MAIFPPLLVVSVFQHLTFVREDVRPGNEEVDPAKHSLPQGPHDQASDAPRREESEGEVEATEQFTGVVPVWENKR